MKTRMSFLTTVAAASILTLSALAAEKDKDALQQRNPNRPAARADERLSDARVERLGQVANASDLIGMQVRNRQEEKLGKIENLVVDLESGRIVQVIISSGGFLGLGDELSAVPPSVFHYDKAQKVLHLDTTKESLAKAPHFKSNQWPDFNDTNYVGDVYRAYGTEPYFSSRAGDADNTRRNVRDRQGGRLTPLDQGNNETDLEITKRIRKEIMDQKDLSVNAHNVKVITLNGRVTLRGAVNTEQERRRIQDIAARIAQGDQVENQIEVKGQARTTEAKD